jgi:hypothetical protein
MLYKGRPISVACFRAIIRSVIDEAEYKL